MGTKISKKDIKESAIEMVRNWRITLNSKRFSCYKLPLQYQFVQSERYIKNRFKFVLKGKRNHTFSFYRYVCMSNRDYDTNV